jgi:hypothetical protein
VACLVFSRPAIIALAEWRVSKRIYSSTKRSHTATPNERGSRSIVDGSKRPRAVAPRTFDVLIPYQDLATAFLESISLHEVMPNSPSMSFDI